MLWDQVNYGAATNESHLTHPIFAQEYRTNFLQLRKQLKVVTTCGRKTHKQLAVVYGSSYVVQVPGTQEAISSGFLIQNECSSIPLSTDDPRCSHHANAKQEAYE